MNKDKAAALTALSNFIKLTRPCIGGPAFVPGLDELFAETNENDTNFFILGIKYNEVAKS